MAYEQVAGPLGPARGDVQAAIVAAVVANSMRTKKGRAFKPEDFLPSWWDQPPGSVEQTPDDQLRLVQQLQRSMGGTRKSRRGVNGGDAGGPGGGGRG